MKKSRALICSESPQLRAVLSDADVAREAVETLERGEHDFVILDASTEHATREHVRSICGARRREMYVLLVSDHVTTGDGEQAWRESVDAVVHTDDAARLGELMDEGRAAKQRLCGRYHEMALERGDG